MKHPRLAGHSTGKNHASSEKIKIKEADFGVSHLKKSAWKPTQFLFPLPGCKAIEFATERGVDVCAYPKSAKFAPDGLSAEDLVQFLQ
jgi:hypothetical protein